MHALKRTVLNCRIGGQTRTAVSRRRIGGRLPQFIDDGAKYQATGAAPGTPFPVGTHLSVPIVLKDGQVYGTLCCFSHHVNGQVNQKDLRKLSYTAGLTADRIDQARRQG